MARKIPSTSAFRLNSSVWLVLAIIVLVIFIWIVSLLKNEILTVLHKSEFDNHRNSMLSGPEYIKVISYNDSKAKIYYVEENRASASVFTFENMTENG